MDIRKLLSLIAKQSDELAPIAGKELDTLAEESLPAIRKTTIPTEVGPEVLGKGTSKLKPDVDNIIDAELVNKTIPEEFKQSFSCLLYYGW